MRTLSKAGALPTSSRGLMERKSCHEWNSCIAEEKDLTCRIRKAHYPPHSHNGVTTHLIRRGSLTIMYPQDENPTKETFGVGARIDVPAGKLHEVWMGDEGCEYVIGE
jgi:hypothetical protein